MSTTEANSLLECTDLVASISEFDYAGPSLDIRVGPGEIVSLVGPDYSGKSDWLKTLAGIHYPASGTIRYKGKTYAELNRREVVQMRMEYAYVQGTTSLLSAASGLANVMLPARYHNIGDYEEIESKAYNISLELGAAQALDTLPAFVRQDQRFKLAVARALILDPSVLFLDKPFAVLDTGAISKFKNVLLHRVRQQQLTVIVVTRDLEFTLNCANKVLFITNEKVYCFESANDFTSSGEEAIREFLSKGTAA